MTDPQPRTALIVGATGLVGAALLPKLLAAPEIGRVIALGRRAPALTDPKLSAVTVDVEAMLAGVALPPVDDWYCALGTTTRTAGGPDGLARIDHALVLACGRAARTAGARRAFVVSAVGADLRSVSHYSRVKAMMERDVAALGFERAVFVRPSLLLGARGESRPLEAFGQRLAPWLSPLLAGPLARYRAVSADAVAEALLRLSRRDGAAVEIRHLPLADDAHG